MASLNLSDENLYERLKEGDEKALQSIILRYWEPLYKMAVNTLDDLLLCEDIVQELFIRLWDKRDTLNLTHSLKAYLFASIRYEVFRQIKQKFQTESLLNPDELNYVEKYNPQNQLELNELMEGVERIVIELPERCREIYQLSREKQLTHKEIADYLKISTKTVENQLTIALRRIRAGIHRMLFTLFF